MAVILNQPQFPYYWKKNTYIVGRVDVRLHYVHYLKRKTGTKEIGLFIRIGEECAELIMTH